jgi:hypothetical protein
MDIKKRRTAAYIAGRLISGKSSAAVYDRSTASHTKITGEVSPNYVSIYDYDRYAYIKGGLTPQGLSIFDYYTRQNWLIKVVGIDFYGYDYESASYFSGEVNKSSVDFYDFQNSKKYNFSV